MKKNWMGTVVLIGVSMVAGQLLSQMWEQVQGQPVGGFAVDAPPIAPQVVVRQPGIPPNWFVDFVSLPPQVGKPEIRAITVVNTEAKKIALYHLNVTDCSLKWFGTRNIQPDLMFDQYDGTSPLPSNLIPELERLGKISK